MIAAHIMSEFLITCRKHFKPLKIVKKPKNDYCDNGPSFPLADICLSVVVLMFHQLTMPSIFFRCASPQNVKGETFKNASHVFEDCPCTVGKFEDEAVYLWYVLVSKSTSWLIADCASARSGNALAMAIGIPIVIACLLLIVFFIYKIIALRKRDTPTKNSHQYSAVYHDTTVEVSKERPVSEL